MIEREKLQSLVLITDGGDSKITVIIFCSCLVNSLVQISERWILSFTTFPSVGRLGCGLFALRDSHKTIAVVLFSLPEIDQVDCEDFWIIYWHNVQQPLGKINYCSMNVVVVLN